MRMACFSDDTKSFSIDNNGADIKSGATISLGVWLNNN